MHSISHLNYRVPKKIAIVFHNGSNYHYHFIIMELAEEFIKKQFICLEENTEKYTTFTVSIENEVTRIDKMDEKFQKIYVTYYNLLKAQGL